MRNNSVQNSSVPRDGGNVNGHSGLGWWALQLLWMEIVGVQAGTQEGRCFLRKKAEGEQLLMVQQHQDGLWTSPGFTLRQLALETIPEQVSEQSGAGSILPPHFVLPVGPCGYFWRRLHRASCPTPM